MGGSGSGSGLGCVGLHGLLPGSQLQTDGAVPRSALLLLPAGKVCQTGSDGERVSLFIVIHFFCLYFLSFSIFNLSGKYFWQTLSLQVVI